MSELTQYLRGWLGYYRLIETPSVLTKLQSWIHLKLRCYTRQARLVEQGHLRELGTGPQDPKRRYVRAR